MKINTALVALGTTRWDAVITFYRQLLEQEPHPYQPNRYAEFALPGLILAIFVPKPDQETAFSQSLKSGLSLCLKVENLDAAIAHLQAMGYDRPFTMESASHGQELHLYDPADNRIILYCPQL